MAIKQLFAPHHYITTVSNWQQVHIFVLLISLISLQRPIPPSFNGHQTTVCTFTTSSHLKPQANNTNKHPNTKAVNKDQSTAFQSMWCICVHKWHWHWAGWKSQKAAPLRTHTGLMEHYHIKNSLRSKEVEERLWASSLRKSVANLGLQVDFCIVVLFFGGVFRNLQWKDHLLQNNPFWDKETSLSDDLHSYIYWRFSYIYIISKKKISTSKCGWHYLFKSSQFVSSSFEILCAFCHTWFCLQ